MNRVFGRWGQGFVAGEDSALDSALMKYGVRMPTTITSDPVDSIVRLGTQANQAAEIAIARQTTRAPAASRTSSTTAVVAPQTYPPVAMASASWAPVVTSASPSASPEESNTFRQVAIGVAVGGGFLLSMALLARLVRG